MTRLIYENLNGLRSVLVKNDKLEKARQVIDDLEADLVCYIEHRQNLQHRSIGMGSDKCSGEGKQISGQLQQTIFMKMLGNSRREAWQCYYMDI